MIIQWKCFTSCWNSINDQLRIRHSTVLSTLLGYLPQKLRDTNCLLSCMVLPVLSLQVPAWGSAGGMLASQEIKEHKHKGLGSFENRNVKHSSTPNRSLAHLPHDLPPAEGDSRKGVSGGTEKWDFATEFAPYFINYSYHKWNMSLITCYQMNCYACNF